MRAGVPSFLVAALTFGCPQPPPPPDGGSELTCDVEAPTSCTSNATYADIQPVVQKNCVVCHHGTDPLGPWPLTSWQDLKDWEDAIRDDIVACNMPPSDAGIPMTNEERLQILEWVRCGSPQ